MRQPLADAIAKMTLGPSPGTATLRTATAIRTEGATVIVQFPGADDTVPMICLGSYAPNPDDVVLTAWAGNFGIVLGGLGMGVGSGTVGPPGNRGAAWWNGSGPPPSYIPGALVGDYYLDVDTGDVYEMTE